VTGVVSEGDLMRRLEIDTDKPRSWWLHAFLSDEDLARCYPSTRLHNCGAPLVAAVAIQHCRIRFGPQAGSVG
jgi:hypothetical protein